MKNIIRQLYKRYQTRHEVNSHLLEPIGMVGCVAFPLLYIVRFIFTLPARYDDLWLRIIAVILCALLATRKWWPQVLKPYYIPYSYFAICFFLPFFMAFTALENHGGVLSVVNMVIGAVLLTFLADWRNSLIIAVLGYATSMTLFLAIHPDQTIPAEFIAWWIPLSGLTSLGGIFFTISEEKMAQERARVTTLLTLAASIAHEIRNPLAQVKYSLDSAENRLPRPSANIREHVLPNLTLDQLYADIAHGQLAIKRGSQIIDMILDEVKGKSLDPESFAYLSAKEVAHKAIEEYGYETEGERNKIRFDIVTDFTFRGDETVMIFILFNLIKNALYYFKTKPEAILSITVSLPYIKVKDTGPGIPKERLPQLFESFKTSGKQAGTGLGLSYCKRSMQAFGGDIVCDSVLGEYTEFTLTFPVVSQEALKTYQQEVLRQAKTVLHGKRILVVDDDTSFRLSTPALLQVLEAEVHVAENGQIALDKMRQTRYDIILLDLNMPVLDGYATAEQIRTGVIPDHRHVPIIAYTTESAYMTEVKTQKVGINGFVSKPCSQFQLILVMLQTLAQCASQQLQIIEEDEEHDLLSGKTILVVDDAPNIRMRIGNMLDNQAMIAIEASHGAEVLELLRSGGHYDAIIMDMQMPGMTGLEAAQAIRAVPSPYQFIPIIMLSGDRHEEHIEAAASLGIKSFLTKPVNSATLYTALRSALGKFTDKEAMRIAEAKQFDTEQISTRAILNTDYVSEFKDTRVLNKMVIAFLEEVPVLLRELSLSVEQNDLQTVKAGLHTLKGSSANIGAELLCGWTTHAHHSTKQGQWPQEKNWLQNLHEVYAKTEASLRARFHLD